MDRYHNYRCVIDGLPGTHATRKFADRRAGSVYLSFFREDLKGKPQWDWRNRNVEVNRTEALDLSRAVIRERLVTLPRRDPLAEMLAKHMTADAKKLEEDEKTGAKKFRYIKTGEDHFGFAFTYALLAGEGISGLDRLVCVED